MRDGDPSCEVSGSVVVSGVPEPPSAELKDLEFGAAYLCSCRPSTADDDATLATLQGRHPTAGALLTALMTAKVEDVAAACRALGRPAGPILAALADRTFDPNDWQSFDGWAMAVFLLGRHDDDDTTRLVIRRMRVASSRQKSVYALSLLGCRRHCRSRDIAELAGGNETQRTVARLLERRRRRPRQRD